MSSGFWEKSPIPWLMLIKSGCKVRKWKINCILLCEKILRLTGVWINCVGQSVHDTTTQRTAPSACQLPAYGRTRNILAIRFDHILFKKSYNFLECDKMRCDVIIALAFLFTLCAGSQLVCSHWTLSIVTIPATDLTKTNELHAKCVRRMTESTDRHVSHSNWMLKAVSI